ncbi:MAG TPA: hypothetical protein VHN58_09630 [Croceicoccus sp.]|nr:hypothetical protein [Croceicoccus sp.]
MTREHGVPEDNSLGTKDYLPPILEHGRGPSHWVRLLRQRGIEISERTLREKANRLKACHKVGRAMIITPEQLEVILRDEPKCRLNPISEAAPGGQKGGSNTTTPPLPITTAKALEHLRNRPRGNGAVLKENGNCVVSFSDRKKRKNR